MKRWVLYFSIFLVASAAFFTADRLCHPRSSNFCAENVRTPRIPSPDREMPPLTPQEKEKVDRILNQKFTYFNTGSQAYSFLSEDKKYVLKVSREKKFRPSSWLCHIPLPFNSYYQRYQAQKKRAAEIFLACRTSFNELRQETGILYVHLNRTHHLKKRITVFWQDGEAHHLNLDKTSFLIQRKANLIYSRITELMSQGKIEEAKNIISSVFSLIDLLGQKGIGENNPAVYKHFGLINDKAVQINISQMRVDLTRSDPQGYKKVIPEATHHFKEWIEKNYPVLAPHFEAELANRGSENVVVLPEEPQMLPHNQFAPTHLPLR